MLLSYDNSPFWVCLLEGRDKQCGWVFGQRGYYLELAVGVVTNNMEDGVFPTIYTEKKDGVQPEFDIRTDRLEIS